MELKRIMRNSLQIALYNSLSVISIIPWRPQCMSCSRVMVTMKLSLFLQSYAVLYRIELIYPLQTHMEIWGNWFQLSYQKLKENAGSGIAPPG